MSPVPDFDDLPKVDGLPQGCAWGIWDKDGQKDVHGTLNLITPDIVRAAYSELSEGISVSLNWPLNSLHTPAFGRKGLEHKVIAFADRNTATHGYDDEVAFNTQASSQWDSLCHYHHQPSASAYNGVQTSAAEITQAAGNAELAAKLPTLNHWHKRGGLVARGVLIDAARWYAEQGRPFSPYNDDVITVDDIEAIARAQGVEFRPGDVLIVRTGYTEQLNGKTDERQRELVERGRSAGLASNVETAKWLWNQHFAAVAGDVVAFEHIPTYYEKNGLPQINLVLHQYLLSLFGMPIGELWDLQELSETCARRKKYSFLLTSAPLNYPGCIGSPPNALALF